MATRRDDIVVQYDRDATLWKDAKSLLHSGDCTRSGRRKQRPRSAVVDGRRMPGNSLPLPPIPSLPPTPRVAACPGDPTVAILSAEVYNLECALAAAKRENARLRGNVRRHLIIIQQLTSLTQRNEFGADEAGNGRQK